MKTGEIFFNHIKAAVIVDYQTCRRFQGQIVPSLKG